MNKAQLVKDRQVQKFQTAAAVWTFTGAVTNSLKDGNSVALVGFVLSQLKSAQLVAATSTGAEIDRCCNIPSFKAGKV